jgi:hypothetical protein
VQQKLCSRVVTLVTTEEGTTLSGYNASCEKLFSALAFAFDGATAGPRNFSLLENKTFSKGMIALNYKPVHSKAKRKS